MRQDTVVGLAAAAAALGTAGGTLALYGLGVPFALGALGLSAAAGLAIRAFVPAPLDQSLPDKVAMLEATIRTLRHDVRGALSPALMMTDRLIGSPDPAIVRAGQAVAKSVTRATDILALTPPTPPAHP